MSGSLIEILRHNAWANEQLYAACEMLTEAQLDATLEGTFGSIRDTLMHVAGAQERYVTALAESAPLSQSREQTPFPGVAALREAIRVSSAALIDLTQQLETQGRLGSDATVTTMHRDEAYTLPVWLVLLQIVNHATEHRGQIATILTQIGVQPPSVDGWTYHETVYAGDWSRLWAW